MLPRCGCNLIHPCGRGCVIWRWLLHQHHLAPPGAFSLKAVWRGCLVTGGEMPLSALQQHIATRKRRAINLFSGPWSRLCRQAVTNPWHEIIAQYIVLLRDYTYRVHLRARSFAETVNRWLLTGIKPSGAWQYSTYINDYLDMRISSVIFKMEIKSVAVKVFCSICLHPFSH